MVCGYTGNLDLGATDEELADAVMFLMGNGFVTGATRLIVEMHWSNSLAIAKSTKLVAEGDFVSFPTPHSSFLIKNV